MDLGQVKEDFNNICDVLLLMLDVYFTIMLFLCMIFFNVSKQEICGYKDTNWPDVESPHYYLGDTPGECHVVHLSREAVLSTWALYFGKDQKKEMLSI